MENEQDPVGLTPTPTAFPTVGPPLHSKDNLVTINNHSELGLVLEESQDLQGILGTTVFSHLPEVNVFTHLPGSHVNAGSPDDPHS